MYTCNTHFLRGGTCILTSKVYTVLTYTFFFKYSVQGKFGVTGVREAHTHLDLGEVPLMMTIAFTLGLSAEPWRKRDYVLQCSELDHVCE